MDTNLNSAKQSARTGLIVCEKCGATILFDDISTDLLDACQSLVKWWDDEGNFASVDAHIWAFDKARAAIARAKGEAEVPA